MRNPVAVLPTLSLVVLLTACGGTEGEVADAGATGVNRPTATVTVTADSEQPATETVTETVTAEPTDQEQEQAEQQNEVSSGTATFGETWSWEDGLEMTISEPEPYQSSGSSFGADGYDHQVMFTITIVNNTGENFDPSMFYATLQSGNREGSQIFDSANGLEGSPSTTLLEGREAQFVIGFGIDNPDDIVMEASPSFEHNSAIYTN